MESYNKKTLTNESQNYGNLNRNNNGKKRILSANRSHSIKYE